MSGFADRNWCGDSLDGITSQISIYRGRFVDGRREGPCALWFRIRSAGAIEYRRIAYSEGVWVAADRPIT